MKDRQGHSQETAHLPELEPGENLIFRLVPEGEAAREVEDLILPAFIQARSMGRTHGRTVDQLVAMHKDVDGGTIKRVSRVDGVTYEIVSINETGMVGRDSTVRAVDGPDAGLSYSADIKRGMRLRGPFQLGVTNRAHE
jgi:hypothetical protein